MATVRLASLVALLALQLGCGAYISAYVHSPTVGDHEGTAIPDDVATPAYVCEFRGLYFGVSNGRFECPLMEGETGGIAEGGSENPGEVAGQIWKAAFGTVAVLAEAAIKLFGRTLSLPTAAAVVE